MSKKITRYDLPMCRACNDYPVIAREVIDGVLKTKVLCCIIDTGYFADEQDAFELWEKVAK